MIRRCAGSVMLGVALIFAGCGSATSASAATVRVEDAWARATVPAATNAAVYMTIIGGSSPDVLTGASVSSSIAGGTMLHKTMAMTPTTASTMPMGSDTSTTMSMDDSEMGMVAISHLDIPAHKTVEFSPGEYHVMLDPIAHQLRAGTSFTLTLHFQHAGDLAVTVAVRS